MIPFVYDLLLWFFSVVLDLFFREIHPRSSWRIPKKGPVLFVAAPHANQFVDPLILLRVIRREAKRRVSFLIAASSMQRPVIGMGAKMIGAVPVARAQDYVKPAVGKIYMPDPENDPLLIRGHGTNFESANIQIGGRIVLPKIKGVALHADVAEILGPEELRIKKPFRDPIAVDLLTGKGNVIPDGKTAADMPKEFQGSSFSSTPKLDQKKVFDAVFAKLLAGGCVGIFPEGGSHDRLELLPLQAGVSIMALGTLSEDPNCGLTIIPCGMNYFHAHKFRSRCVVEFGPPVEVKPEYITQYNDKDERPKAVNALLEEIHDALRAVTVNAPDYDTLMTIQAVRRLYKPDHKKLPLPYIVELNRRLIKGYAKYKDNPLIIDLKKSVLSYNRQLMELQIRDHQVAYAKLPRIKALGMLIWRIIVLSSYTIAVLPGLLMFAPVFIAGKLISMKKSKEALAASSVKVEAKDVMATWKLLVALGLAPVLYLVYSLLAVVIAHQNHLWGYQPEWLTLPRIFILSWIVFPGITYAALRFGENGMDIFKSMRPLVIALSPYHGRMLTQLREQRAELVVQVNHAINTLGPELFPDFERIRIIPEWEVGGRISAGDERKYSRELPDMTLSEPSTPSSPTFRYGEHMIRSDSYTNLGSVNVFSSHPPTPRPERSRSNSFGGGNAFAGIHGFSPIDQEDGAMASVGTSSEELSRRIRGAMRERSARRRSESERGSGTWSSGASTPDSSRGELDGLTMTKKNV